MVLFNILRKEYLTHLYKQLNLNPLELRTGDCVVRALAMLFDQSWDKTYTDLSLQGFVMGRMPSDNSVHRTYLEQRGYYLHPVPNDCPDCITVAEFARKFPKGNFLLSTDGHVVCLKDGTYYDTFDSGSEIVNYFFHKRKE